MNEKFEEELQNGDVATSSTEKKKGNRLGTILSWTLTAVLFLALIGVTFLNLQTKIVVDGNSMNVTLLDGDILCVNVGGQADRGDIVIVDVSDYAHKGYGGVESNYVIKRLIAVEGDKIRCRNHVMEICYAGESEFVALEEEYVSPNYQTRDFSTVTVGAGEIFIAGDNRSPGGSLDSRTTGCFKEENIYAVVPDWSYSVRGFVTGWYNFWTQFSGGVEENA